MDSSAGVFSLLVRRLAKAILQRDHDGLMISSEEHQRQVTAVFNLRTKLSKLICNCPDDATTQVGENEPDVLSHDLRVA